MGTHGRERGSCVRTFQMLETSNLRPRIEAAIEGLLSLLDEMDGDPDLEPGEDAEPALGSLEQSWNRDIWSRGGRDDSEQDAGDEPEEDPAEMGLADPDAVALLRDESLAINALGFNPVDLRLQGELRRLRCECQARLGRKIRDQRRAKRKAKLTKAG